MPGLVAYCYWVIRGATPIKDKNFYLLYFDKTERTQLKEFSLSLLQHKLGEKYKISWSKDATNTSACILENVGRHSCVIRGVLQISRPYFIGIFSPLSSPLPAKRLRVRALGVVMLDWLLHHKSH